jgi:mannose-6-phosphate isomerase-like protein (cupin superfamily)
MRLAAAAAALPLCAAAVALLSLSLSPQSWSSMARLWSAPTCARFGSAATAARTPTYGSLSTAELLEETHEWLRTRSNVTAMHNEATGERWYAHSPPLAMGGRMRLLEEGVLAQAGAADDVWEMYETMEPGGFVNVQHVHPEQSELVVVIQGTVRCEWIDPCAGGAGEVLLRPGDWVHVPPGLSHGLQNHRHDAPAGQAPDADDVVMRVRYAPGKEMHDFFASLARLSHSGALNVLPMMAGIPDPLHTSQLWRRFPRIMAFWFMPPQVQSLLAWLGAPLADALGLAI